MTKGTHNKSDIQLSLFEDKTDDQDIAVKELMVDPNEPQWEFPIIPNMDFVADQPVIVYYYSLEVLEKECGYYVWPIFRQMMAAFVELRTSKRKDLRNATFTVFGDDVKSLGFFALAIGSYNAGINEVFASRLESVPGYTFTEGGDSRNLRPLFRYDRGYVIQYTEDELAGTSYQDSESNFGSEMTIYRRASHPASKSTYGILTHSQTPAMRPLSNPEKP